MIAKISTGSSLYGALSYNQEKVDVGEGKVLSTHIINQSPDGQFQIAACMQDFESWMPSHFRTKNTVMHVSLNPHPDDKLTDVQLAAIGEEYMQKLGYGDQPYIIFKHEDIDRHHIHIVSLRVDSEGKKINDSYEHERSKAITKELEEKYNLRPAEGQTNRQEEWQLTPINAKQGNLKRQISNVLKPLIVMYKFQTLGEYRALLSLYNISVEEVKGEAKGKPYKGLIYSALDSQGNKVGVPLKSSLFGKLTGQISLRAQMKESTGNLKTTKGKKTVQQCRTAVSKAMVASATEESFISTLWAESIDVVLRRNEGGRIYGVTFIDHNSRQVLNGSQLGKDYSANMFNDWFVGNVCPSGFEATGRGESHVQEESSTQQPPLNHTNGNIEADNDDAGEQQSATTLHSDTDFSFNLFEPGSGPADEPVPRKKRKKRRKPGQQL